MEHHQHKSQKLQLPKSGVSLSELNPARLTGLRHVTKINAQAVNHKYKPGMSEFVDKALNEQSSDLNIQKLIGVKSKEEALASLVEHTHVVNFEGKDIFVSGLIHFQRKELVALSAKYNCEIKFETKFSKSDDGNEILLTGAKTTDLEKHILFLKTRYIHGENTDTGVKELSAALIEIKDARNKGGEVETTPEFKQLIEDKVQELLPHATKIFSVLNDTHKELYSLPKKLSEVDEETARNILRKIVETRWYTIGSESQVIGLEPQSPDTISSHSHPIAISYFLKNKVDPDIIKSSMAMTGADQEYHFAEISTLPESKIRENLPNYLQGKRESLYSKHEAAFKEKESIETLLKATLDKDFPNSLLKYRSIQKSNFGGEDKTVIKVSNGYISFKTSQFLIDQLSSIKQGFFQSKDTKNEFSPTKIQEKIADELLVQLKSVQERIVDVKIDLEGMNCEALNNPDNHQLSDILLALSNATHLRRGILGESATDVRASYFFGAVSQDLAISPIVTSVGFLLGISNPGNGESCNLRIHDSRPADLVRFSDYRVGQDIPELGKIIGNIWGKREHLTNLTNNHEKLPTMLIRPDKPEQEDKLILCLPTTEDNDNSFKLITDFLGQNSEKSFKGIDIEYKSINSEPVMLVTFDRDKINLQDFLNQPIEKSDPTAVYFAKKLLQISQ